MHCNTLQHTTMHCNTLQHTTTHCNTLQHTTMHCNTVQHTATRNKLQYTQLTFAVFPPHPSHCFKVKCGRADRTKSDTLQLTATNCNTLQRTATNGNKLQHTELTYSIYIYIYIVLLQHPRHCLTVQRTATNDNKLQHTELTFFFFRSVAAPPSLFESHARDSGQDEGKSGSTEDMWPLVVLRISKIKGRPSEVNVIVCYKGFFQN